MELIKPLFKYLDSENIQIDKNEFEYQLNSHPDYPSLLAISDTLSFFNISNAAFRISFENIGQLPDRFMASIKRGKEQIISFVEKKENSFFYSDNGNRNHSKLTEHELKLVWDEIVLLAESSEDNLTVKKKMIFKKGLVIPFIIFSAVLLYFIIPSLQIGLFYVFPLLGFFLSIVALKDLFNSKNELFDKFCNIAANTSCESVLKSTKWTVLEKFNFSDLGIIFFSSQIVALTLFSLKFAIIGFFQLQLILLFCSIPVMGLSIYYQAYVKRKWCPICLTIIGVIIAELIFVLSITDISISAIGGIEIVILGFVFTLVGSSWFQLKRNLEHLKRLKIFEMKANRFKRNYSIFRKMLKSSPKFDMPISPIKFGNPESPLQISIVTSPFCGYCKEPHYMLKSILDKYENELGVSIFYNVNPKNKRLIDFSTRLIFLATTKGQDEYYRAMDFWYQVNDDSIWNSKYMANTDTSEIEKLLDLQHPWFAENDINFTPCIFLNGIRFPKEYELNELPHFIPDLVEDARTLIIQ